MKIISKLDIVILINFFKITGKKGCNYGKNLTEF